MTKQGIPANTNPFCANSDDDIFDGALEQTAPNYFGTTHDFDSTCAGWGTYAKQKIKVPELSQAEAEKLFLDLAGVDYVNCLVVKEEFIHIIPKDWPEEVWITKGAGETCTRAECYASKPNSK
ncbi:MAG: hypothetical protein HY225_01225 [Candidatus Vogelbacteria bacterium]|nr:hypothetical protein [Candidatus Vogelbacteria bacterium]